MTVLSFFPENLCEPWNVWENRWNEIQEIRLRVNCPVMIRTQQGEYFLKNNISNVIYSDKDMENVFRHLCHDSVYAYEEERKWGYLTLTGGHRVGITGEIIYRENQGYIVKYIRYMNIRIAHEMTGIAQDIMSYLYEHDLPCNTLIISPPAIGKTTLLRDMIRMYADGNGEHVGINVGIIDERGEIAGAYRGSASLNCGMRSDVITGGNKRNGVEVLVRTFAPRVVAMDEIGCKGDAQAVLYAGVSGCAVLATAHGTSIEDVTEKEELSMVMKEHLFKRYIVLHKNEKGDRYVKIWDGEGRCICGKKQLQQY